MFRWKNARENVPFLYTSVLVFQPFFCLKCMGKGGMVNVRHLQILYIRPLIIALAGEEHLMCIFRFDYSNFVLYIHHAPPTGWNNIPLVSLTKSLRTIFGFVERLLKVLWHRRHYAVLLLLNRYTVLIITWREKKSCTNGDQYQMDFNSS